MVSMTSNKTSLEAAAVDAGTTKRAEAGRTVMDGVTPSCDLATSTFGGTTTAPRRREEVLDGTSRDGKFQSECSGVAACGRGEYKHCINTENVQTSYQEGQPPGAKRYKSKSKRGELYNVQRAIVARALEVQ